MNKIKQKTKVWEERKLRVENVINLACTNINDAKIIMQIHIEDKVIQLSLPSKKRSHNLKSMYNQENPQRCWRKEEKKQVNL